MKTFCITWDVTDRCNKQCQHCYIDAGDQMELSYSELNQALSKLDSTLNRWGRIGLLAFTGGEALLRKDEVMDLMDTADNLPAIGCYELLTNGSLLTDEIAERLKDFRKLTAVQLSLESSSPEINDAIRGKGSWEETLQAVKLLKKRGLRVNISTTVSKSNREGIGDLILWADRQGVDEIGFDRLISSGNGRNLSPLTKEELQQAYAEIHCLASKTRSVRVIMRRTLFCLTAPEDYEVGAMCSAGINNLSVLPDGTIYPCRWLPIPIGNILSDDLDSIWREAPVLVRLRKKKEVKGKCQDCPFLVRCRGCRGMAYYKSGDYLEEDPQCWR